MSKIDNSGFFAITADKISASSITADKITFLPTGVKIERVAAKAPRVCCCCGSRQFKSDIRYGYICIYCDGPAQS